MAKKAARKKASVTKKKVLVKTAKQLAIFLSNRPGTLAAACAELANAKVGIEALATEGGDFGPQGGETLVRMVVNDSAKAVQVLGNVGATAIQTDVLLIEGAHEPGILAEIADRLSRAEINIESVYVSANTKAKHCIVILRPSNVAAALRVLDGL